MAKKEGERVRWGERERVRGKERNKPGFGLVMPLKLPLAYPQFLNCKKPTLERESGGGEFFWGARNKYLQSFV